MSAINTIKEKASFIWLTVKSLFSNDEATREEIDKKYRTVISGVAGLAGFFQAFVAAGMMDAGSSLSDMLPHIIISAVFVIISLRISDR